MKKELIEFSLKGLTYGITFSLGVIGIVYASSLLTPAQEGAPLTLTMWNSVVDKLNNITEQIDTVSQQVGPQGPAGPQGPVGATGATGPVNISTSVTPNRDTHVPSEKAVKTYVDTQVQASGGGGSGIPTQISKRYNSASFQGSSPTLGVALRTCNALGAGWRLPTFEEALLVVGKTDPEGVVFNESQYFWTRTQSSTQGNRVIYKPDTGEWSNYTSGGNYFSFRCVY